MKQSDYMNAPMNDAVLKDSKPVNAARECTFMQGQLTSLQETHRALAGERMSSSELWDRYNQAFKTVLG